MLVYFALADAIFFCVTRRQTPDPSQWNIGGVGSSGVGHVHFMLFVQLFPRWQRENQPTQRQIPVEYGLKALKFNCIYFSENKLFEGMPFFKGMHMKNGHNSASNGSF